MKTRNARAERKKVVKSDPYGYALPKKRSGIYEISSADDAHFETLESEFAKLAARLAKRLNKIHTVDTNEKGHGNAGHGKSIATSTTKREKVNNQSLPSPPSTLFVQLQALQDKDGIIKNTKQFDCVICMTKIGTNDGVVLRDCLHQFCYDCTKNAIVASDDAEIPCPFGDGKNRCEGIILDHEIRAILSAKQYETYLNRSLRIAEAVISNTVHCKKVDCVVWCICDDDVKQFVCGLCQSPNCVPCKVMRNECKITLTALLT